MQGVDVEAVVQRGDPHPGGSGGVLDDVIPTRFQGGLVGHPAHHRVELGAGVGLVLRPRQQIAAGDVDIVGETDRHRHWRKGLRHWAFRPVDGRDPTGFTAGQHHHLVAGAHDPAGDGAGIAAVVGVFAGLWPDHVLHRKAHVDQVAVTGDVDILEVAQQRWTVVPGCLIALGHHVVAVQCRDRDGGDVVNVEPGRKGVELVANPVVALLIPVDEVHLVDRQHDVLHPEQRGQEGVPPGLLQQSVTGVDEHDHQLRGGGAGDHVAGVLQVPRGVGDDEFSLGGAEVAVGDVDGDALLTLGTQSVGHQSKVGVFVAAFAGGAFDGRKLILHHGLGVIQQPADQGGLAVVDRTRGGQSKQRSGGQQRRRQRCGHAHQK